MATSAFKSTSRRSTLLPSATSPSSSTTKTHRRARSLSRVSRRPESELPAASQKGKFVNTARGSEFADVSLDDLALEFFSSSAQETSNDEAKTREGRSARRSSEIGRWANPTESSSLRRGRSLSRQNNNNSSNANNSGSISNCGSNMEQSGTRRRRSVSVVRNRISDSEGINFGAKSSSSNNSGGKVAQSITRRRRSLSVAPNQISDSEGINFGAKSSSSNNSGGEVAQSITRRRRSLSVAPNQISDSESDKDLSLSYGRHSNSKDHIVGRNQMSSSVLRAAPKGRRLERSISLKDISLLNDGYSSQSSVLTDEEPRYAHQNKFGTEKTIRTVYAQKKSEYPTDDGSNGLYEAMKKEIRHAVEEIRTELEQAVGRTNTTREVDEEEIHQSLAEVKQKYAVKSKQRGNDRSRASSKLVEEAEKYFEDFLSNVEDTDVSSFDGERSEGSSILGCPSRARSGTNYTEAESFHSPAVPLGTDGVILPWLQWESSNDASLSMESIARTPGTPTALKFDAEEEMSSIQDSSSHLLSSRGSSSSNLFTSLSITPQEDGEMISGARKRSQFDMEEYLHLQKKEDHLFEMYKARQRISCGGLLLCAGGL